MVNQFLVIEGIVLGSVAYLETFGELILLGECPLALGGIFQVWKKLSHFDETTQYFHRNKCGQSSL